jgi:regulator of replication initiation timing
MDEKDLKIIMLEENIESLRSENENLRDENTRLKDVIDAASDRAYTTYANLTY